MHVRCIGAAFEGLCCTGLRLIVEFGGLRGVRVCGCNSMSWRVYEGHGIPTL